jgi:hypothetical protein
MESGVALLTTSGNQFREKGLAMKEFIEKVLGTASGNAFVSRASGKTANGKLNINIHNTFKYPAQLQEMIAYGEQYASEDVYLSPLLYGDKKNDRGQYCSDSGERTNFADHIHGLRPLCAGEVPYHAEHSCCYLQGSRS